MPISEDEKAAKDAAKAAAKAVKDAEAAAAAKVLEDAKAKAEADAIAAAAAAGAVAPPPPPVAYGTPGLHVVLHNGLGYHGEKFVTFGADGGYRIKDELEHLALRQYAAKFGGVEFRQE